MKKHPGGRPPIEIDWKVVDQLCDIQCTEAEIAAILGINIDTLAGKLKKEKNCSFPEYFAEKSAGGKASLRRRQYQVAMGNDTTAPNSTMLIWLGKQWLGQKDSQSIEHSGSISSGVLRVPEKMTPEEWAAAAEAQQSAIMGVRPNE